MTDTAPTRRRYDSPVRRQRAAETAGAHPHRRRRAAPRLPDVELGRAHGPRGRRACRGQRAHGVPVLRRPSASCATRCSSASRRSRASTSTGSRSTTSPRSPHGCSSTCRRSRSRRGRRATTPSPPPTPGNAPRCSPRSNRTPPRGRRTTGRSRRAVLDVLWSVVSYERMVVDWELAPDDAIRGLTWAIELVEAAVRNGASPHATMHAQPIDEGDR